MGTLTKILVIKLLFFTLFAKSQIVKLENSDKYILVKLDELNEDGISFYKNEYSLVIYNKENIKYNKEKGYRPKTYAGGRIYCDKCKKEEYNFRIKKISKKIYNLKIFSTKELFNNINKFAFGNTYFNINGVYYKSLGMPME